MTDTDESLRTMLARSGTAPDYTMRILENETGIAPETLRSWEHRHGFPTPARTRGNQRRYSQRDIAAVRWLLEQTRQGHTISSAIAILKRHLPDHENDGAASPVDELAEALEQGDLAAAQTRWDDLVLTLSIPAIGQTLLRLHELPHLPGRARAFLLRKAIVLLDAASPDTGRPPLAIITSGQPDAELPATVAAASLARDGYRILLPFPAISSLADISTIRDFGAHHALLVDITESDTTALRALLPDIPLVGWNPGETSLNTLLDRFSSR